MNDTFMPGPLSGGFWLCQEDPVWPEDLDVLRHAGVRGPRDHPEQGPQLQRGLLVPGDPGL